MDFGFANQTGFHVDHGIGVNHILQTYACRVTIVIMKFGGHQNHIESVVAATWLMWLRSYVKASMAIRIRPRLVLA